MKEPAAGARENRQTCEGSEGNNSLRPIHHALLRISVLYTFEWERAGPGIGLPYGVTKEPVCLT